MKNRIALFVAAGAAMAVVTLSGCNQNQKETAAAGDKAVTLVNTKCPFSGGPARADTSVEYKGENVGFCCAGCKSKWAKTSDADRDAMLAKAK